MQRGGLTGKHEYDHNVAGLSVGGKGISGSLRGEGRFVR